MEVARLEIWSSGGMLRARGRGGGTEVWSSGALEVCCRRVDVAVLRYEDLELRRHAAGLETWRYGALELRRRAVGVRRGDIEVWRPGDALQAVDVEM